MKSVTIKAEGFSSREALHEYIADQLDFPGYYGRNLDALYDVLTDVDEPTYIEINLEGLGAGEWKDYMDRVVKVITDATGENGYLELTVVEDEEEAEQAEGAEAGAEVFGEEEDEA